MSPLDRLAWLRALAGTDAPTCAWKVAVVLADHVNSESGLAWPGLRTALGVDAAKRGARWLATAGLIEVVEAPPGKPAVYRLTRGNAAPGAELHRVQLSTPTRGNAAPGEGAGLHREGGQGCPPNQGYQGLNQGDEPGSDRAEVGKPMKTKTREIVERFTKPAWAEVEAYCTERENGIDPAHFVDHYEANGWRVGKTPMRDWRAAVRTWERHRRPDHVPASAVVRLPIYAPPKPLADLIPAGAYP